MTKGHCSIAASYGDVACKVYKCIVMQAQICNRFGIKGYPTMKFGHVSDFEEGSKQGLIELNGKQTAEEVVKWLSKEMST